MRRDRNIIDDTCNCILSLLIIVKDEYFSQRIFIRKKLIGFAFCEDDAIW